MSEHTPLTEAERIEALLAAHRLGSATGKPWYQRPGGTRNPRNYAQTYACKCGRWEGTHGDHLAHVADALAARTSTATADTAEVLPLAEDYDGCICAYAHDARTPEDNQRLKAGCDLYRQHAATADTGHKAGCQEFPTGWLCVSDCTTVWHDKDAADTGLRERVEALADQWRWATPKGYIAGVFYGARDCARLLQDALDATPASTEDRADNEGTP